MKRLILDHFRRWFWVLALCAIIAFLIGVWITAKPEQPFEFWLLLTTMWTGANLLSIDQKQGLSRAVTVLPLTGRQIGRSWWLATVVFPAIGLTALLSAGALTACLMESTNTFPLVKLILGSVFTLVWLGTMFAMIIPSQSLFIRGRKRHIAFLIRALSMLILFGSMVLSSNLTKSPAKCIFLLAAGAVLIAVGWFRAENYTASRVSFAFAPVISLSNQTLPQHRPTKACGGIRFLMITTCVRMFLMGLSLLVMLSVVMALQTHGNSWQIDAHLIAGVGCIMSCMVPMIIVLPPVLWQLRFLRTIPLSATRLTLVLILMALLPIIAHGLLWASLAGLTLGAADAISILKSYLLILAPGSVCIFLAVWLGFKDKGVISIVATMIAFQILPVWFATSFHSKETPFILGGAVAGGCVLLSFFLTRRIITRSSSSYKVQSNTFGNPAYGVGR